MLAKQTSLVIIASLFLNTACAKRIVVGMEYALSSGEDVVVVTRGLGGLWVRGQVLGIDEFHRKVFVRVADYGGVERGIYVLPKSVRTVHSSVVAIPVEGIDRVQMVGLDARRTGVAVGVGALLVAVAGAAYAYQQGYIGGGGD